MNLRLLLALPLLFCVASLQASDTRVTDSARLLSNSQVASLQSHLSGKPIWVETFTEPPAKDLRTYAEARIARLAPGDGSVGFLIAISTNPRKWEIRMSPVGKVSGEAVRQIGERMVAEMRAGRAYEGISTAADRLNGLVTPMVEPSHQTDAAPKEQRDREKTLNVFAIAVTIGVLGIIATALVVYLRARRLREAEEERIAEEQRQERQRQAKKAREERAAREREYEARRQREAKEQATKQIEESRDNPVKAESAQKAFGRYTEEERRQFCSNHCNSPYYSPGAATDPFAFYWMGLAAGAFTAHGDVPPPAPVVERSSPSSYEPHSRREDSSSSYSSSSSSSSYDSGSSSSYDSGSSSSGGGGDW